MPASRACSSQQCLVCHLYADTGYSWACLLPKPRAVQDRSSLETGPSRYTSRAMQVKRCSGAPRGNLKLHLMCWGGSGLGSMTEEREVGKGLWGWAEKLLTSLPLCLGSSTNLCATDTNKTLRSQPGSPHPPPLLLGAPGLASPLCSSLVHFSLARYETGELHLRQPAASCFSCSCLGQFLTEEIHVLSTCKCHPFVCFNICARPEPPYGPHMDCAESDPWSSATSLQTQNTEELAQTIPSCLNVPCPC